MKTFMLDLIEDLREKRLLPVAIALVVGIVAIPVVLANGGSSPSSDDASATAQAPAGASAAQRRIAALVKSGDLKQSDLDKLTSKDPFKPPTGYAKRARVADATGKTDAAKDATSSGGSSGGNSDSPSSGGGNTGGSGGNGDSGGGPRKTTAYSYVADVTFSHNGNSRLRHLGRLSMLPSASNPLLLFLGVTEGGDNAAFLVDSSLKAVGEGKCTPSRAECANVYLGAGAEEEFTDANGESYTLRVEEIRKVKVTRTRAAKSSRSKKARASSGKATTSRRFTPPVLVDVIESSSSSSKEGR